MLENHNHCIFSGVYPKVKGNKEKEKKQKKGGGEGETLRQKLSARD